MVCVNGCFEADGPDRSWSEMSWDLGRREKHHAKVKFLTGFFKKLFRFYTLSFSLRWFAISFSFPIFFSSLWEVIYWITSFALYSFPSLTISKEVHTQVIKSVIYKLNYPPFTCCHLVSLAICFPFPSSSLSSFFFYIIDSPRTRSLQLFIASPLVLSCLVASLSNSPERAWQIVSVHETR